MIERLPADHDNDFALQRWIPQSVVKFAAEREDLRDVQRSEVVVETYVLVHLSRDTLSE